jgi:hypothetical protein
MTPTTYRIALAPFQPTLGGVQTVVCGLAPKGFRPDQACLVGTPSSIAPLSSVGQPANSIYPHLLANLEPLHTPATGIPVVATSGPISHILLKQQSWLSTTATAPLRTHLDNGNVVLAVNSDNHDQFVYAARLMLRHANGNLSSHIFDWPPRRVW